MKNRKTFYSIFCIATITACAIVVLYNKSLEIQSKKRLISSDLIEIRDANPERDLSRDIESKAAKFLAVPDIPGVILGIDDPIVTLQGTRSIKGSGDFINSSEQGQLQQIAKKYALRYNANLHKYLISKANNNNAVKESLAQVEATLRDMESKNPISQAKHNRKENEIIFLSVIDPNYSIPGVREQDIFAHESKRVRIKTVLISRDLTTKDQYSRFQAVIKNYIKPYNRALLVQLRMPL